MKKLIGVILGSLMVFALNATVLQAAEYEITVCVDETTAGDLSMVEGFMNSAADGAKVSKSLRRVAMAAVGELGLALKARVDSYGSLTLDDGGVVSLYDGDTVITGTIPCDPIRAGNPSQTLVTIKFKASTTGGGNTVCRPTHLRIERAVDPYTLKVIVSMDIPPSRVTGTK